MTGAEPRPYWRDVGTVDAFWQANIDLTDFVPELDIYSTDWPIWTYGEVTPPAKFIHDEDNRRGSAVSSMVSGGCIISGSTIRSEEHTSELQSLMRISYAVFCFKKKKHPY